MKPVIDPLGKFLVAAVVSTLIVSATGALLIPAVRDFVTTLFIEEQNYVEVENGSAAPTITCANENVSLSIDDTVDLFSDIIALSSSGADLTAQLINDYSKTDIDKRQHVFVYEILSDNTNILSPNINTSRPGNWKVFYLVKDGTESAVLAINYIIS